MSDIEHLKMMDLEDQLKFCRGKNKDLQKEVNRLTAILNGEDVIMNSLPESKEITTPFDKLKSSYRNKDNHK